MKRLNLNEAIKEIAELELEYNSLKSEIYSSEKYMKSYTIENDKREYLLSDEYDFEHNVSNLMSLAHKINDLKNKIHLENSKNNVTIDNEEVTLQEAVLKLNTLKEQFSMLKDIENMAKYSKEEKKGIKGAQSYYLVKEPNFNQKALAVLLAKMCEDIAYIKSCISEANNKIVINVGGKLL